MRRIWKLIFHTGAGTHAYRTRAGSFGVFAILLCVCLFSVLPLVYSVAQSVKPMEELFAFPPRFLVQNPTADNYRRLFRLAGTLTIPFSRYAFNSVFAAAVGSGLYVVVASMAAYPLALHKFPGSRLINAVIVQALLFNVTVLAVVQYVIIAKADMLNTYRAMILPIASAPLGLFLMRQFMVQMIPPALVEAAKIDGADVFQTFWRVIMPVVKPAWMTLIILSFQNLWGNSGSVYIYDEAMKALPAVLAQLAAGGVARAGVGAAAAVVLMAPPAAVFFYAQSNVLETMSSSGIK